MASRFEMHIPVTFGNGQITSQFFRSPARSISWRIALDAPPFLERSRIDNVEPEAIDHVRNGSFGGDIVARDHERTPVWRACRLPVRRQLGCVDVIERFDDLRRRQMPLQQLGCRRRFVVELRNVSVALRVIVVRSITTFPWSGLTGTVPMAFKGILTTTMSPAAAVSVGVAARAWGPSSAMSGASVSGPRELLITTS
jgi:hypothetical protein